MVKRKVNWSKNALIDLHDIMNYYNKRNKSNLYSLRLNRAVREKLQTLDLSITLPQKTSLKNMHYFMHNHILVCFEIQNNELRVQVLIDDRRNPELIKKMLNTTA